MTFSKLKLATTGVSLFFAAFLTTGCHVQSYHPNQINTFDGSAYDTLTLAHSALTSLRGSVATDFPRYLPEFNKAAGTYNTAVVVYSAYRNSAALQQSVTVALGNLAVDITTLESALVSDLHVDAQHAAAVRKSARKIRAWAAPHLTVADVLAELEIAASIAANVPAIGAYATLAKAIIQATETALGTAQAQVGKPIRLDTIAVIIPIP